MKTGFYLRPDGKEIIQIIDYQFDDIDKPYKRLRSIVHLNMLITEQEFNLLFGNWIYLGV